MEHDPVLELDDREYVCPNAGCWLVHWAPAGPSVCDAL